MKPSKYRLVGIIALAIAGILILNAIVNENNRIEYLLRELEIREVSHRFTIDQHQIEKVPLREFRELSLQPQRPLNLRASFDFPHEYSPEKEPWTLTYRLEGKNSGERIFLKERRYESVMSGYSEHLELFEWIGIDELEFSILAIEGVDLKKVNFIVVHDYNIDAFVVLAISKIIRAALIILEVVILICFAALFYRNRKAEQDA